MTLDVGTRLAHYDVTALIGEGGMGEVYRGPGAHLGTLARSFPKLLVCLVVAVGLEPAGVANGQASRGPEVTSHTVLVGDINIHYRTAGDGEPLVLVHGFTHTSRVWDPFITDLTQDFRLIMVDMRGHGGSDNVSGEFTHRLAALDLLGLMDALGIDRFKGAGHSSGAATLLEAAVMNPDRIEGMVLVAGTHRFTDEAREGLSSPGFDQFRETYPGLYKAVTAWHPGGARQVRELMAQTPQLAADPGLTAE